jgi:cytochrome c554/c'-like protein
MARTCGIVTGLMVAIVLIAIAAVAQTHQQRTEKAQIEFLKEYWRVPIPLQGRAPRGWSESEISLAPETCGGCHPQQFKDWRTTVHSRAVGPGLLGQTPALLRTEPTTAKICYSCHSPLTEQQELISSRGRFSKNPQFDLTLQSKGLTCAACHVRNYQRFGPPRRDGSLESRKPAVQLPHGDATRTPAFERAEFCKGCHQFEEDGYALNGKLLENTYNEWKDSPYAAEGLQCQQCHMPDRRHLWRGIHDPEMVKSGVEVDLSLNKQTYEVGDKLEGTLTLTNRRVGHYFPTYVTPKVVLRIELLGANGDVIFGSVKQEIVGRRVSLDLAREIADTRIPPMDKRTFNYSANVDRTGLKLHAVVIIYPDDFYARFYEAKLASQLSTVERQRLSQALIDTRTSVYKLFEREIPL